MAKFPVDAPIDKVVKTFEHLGFKLVRDGSHISMLRENPDGSKTPLTMPNHRRIKGSTLRTILTQAGISREEFLTAYEER
jgi:predicted RNA binding protein YcfA (HicA-like mRNA interferase family)